MSEEFRFGLREVADDVAARHQAHPGLPVPLIERTARSRRRRHEVVLASASAAVVAVILLAGSALGRLPAPTPPVGTETPTETASQTPSPTPTGTSDTAAAPPTEAGRTLAAKGTATEPDAWVMTDATWADVGPGWALAVFSTVTVINSEIDYGSFDPAGTQALFLVAPDGTTYRLVSLPADGYGQVMWWDPAQRKAWMFFQRLGESWGQVEVDLRDGSLAGNFVGQPSPPQHNLFPVEQRTDGRILWADADPVFPGPVEGLYWQETDGSFSPIAGTTDVEGDAWLDPHADRVVFLTRTGAAAGAGLPLALVSLDLTDDAASTTVLGGPSGATGCSLVDVLDASVLVSCDGTEPFTQQFYDVSPTGEWSNAAEREPSTRLIHEMLLCGASELPWSPSGRILPAPLAAQGWRDASVLVSTPGAPLTVPKVSYCTP